ncbi:MAG: 6-carboxytetrahydropterin synthase [Bacteroidales bacterium]|nr:6-carboxytetrahydropterin synthase [Bacteroidales bacterium]
MSYVYVTRRERFNAAHRMFNPDWSDEKNLEVYGKCSNPLWHGHNYELYVTIKGHIKPELGYLLNLTDLSRIIREQVINLMDHKNLNLEVDFLKGKVMSSENITVAIWEKLSPYIRALGAELHCIRLVETENNIVEYYGE